MKTHTLGLCKVVAKSSVSVNHAVPVKVLNVTDSDICVGDNMVLANFKVLNPTEDKISELPETLYQESKQSQPKAYCANGVLHVQEDNSELQKFASYFDLNNVELDENEKAALLNCLYHNRDIFVTDENTDVGFTNLVKHKINLKPDAKPKHRQPYRLPPTKREVLRHHLDELLRQGIICPIDVS